MKVMCEVLEVSRSGFYAWRSRPESKRSKHHRELVSEMRQIHADRDMKSYGSPRILAAKPWARISLATVFSLHVFPRATSSS